MRLPLLILHLLGGSVGLLAGTVAMCVRKGGRLHRMWGTIFSAAMMLLAASGLCLGILKGQTGNIVGGVITFYLIGTAWLAGRGRSKTSLVDWGALVFGVVGGVGALAVGRYTLQHPAGAGSPAGMSFFLGSVLLLAAVGDGRMLVRGGVRGRPRLIRHVWRMCFGLFIATGSFFLGQQQVFPVVLRGSMLLTVLAVLPLGLLVYWVVRVRFGKTYARLRTVSGEPGAVAET